MSVSKKDRAYILKNYPRLSVKELSQELKISESEVRQVLEAGGFQVAKPRPALLGYTPFQALGVVMLVAAVSVVYMNSARNGFHYDDIHSLLENLGVRVEWTKNPESRSLFYRYFYQPELFSSRPGVAMPRPILMCTFALNYMISRYEPWSWMFANILLHLVNSIIIYIGLCHLAGRHRFALLTALLFALHPINTETANYINCRSESLSALFMLLTMYCFARSLREERTDLRLASLLFFTLGLLTKELVFVTPALLVVIDAIFIYPENKDRITLRKRIVTWYGPIFGLWVLYLVYRELVLAESQKPFLFISAILIPLLWLIVVESVQYVLRRREGATAGEHLLREILLVWTWFFYIGIWFLIVKHQGRPFAPVRPIPDNIITQSRVLISYLRLLFLPLHQNISYENTIYTVRQFMQNPFRGLLLPSILLLGGLAGLCLSWIRRLPLVSFAIANFFITLSITSSVIPLNAIMNEHRLYLPSLGACLLLAALLEQTAQTLNRKAGTADSRWPMSVQAICVFILLAFAALTAKRNFSWYTDLTVWRDSIWKSPTKAQVVADLGNAYYRGGRALIRTGEIARDGKIDRKERIIIAQTFLQDVPAGQITPEIRDILDRLYIKGLRRAEQLYNWAKRVEYTYYKAWHNLGTIYYTYASIARDKKDLMEAKRDLETGINYFYQAAKIYPNGESFNDMASTLLKLSELEDDPQKKQQLLEQILQYYFLAIKYNPELYKGYANAGQILIRLQRPAKALKYFEQALKINPMDVQLYLFKGGALEELHRFAEAIQAYDHCLRIAPNAAECVFRKQNLLNRGTSPKAPPPP